ncbi:hypothetical protein ACFHYQ_08930 [Sphaerimonospora cavernae]|uniref:DUF222 domain-containing protein n=1 Tax=Sphaerimonospora cavernae TaxID=1740611 RepID=A0ABV6U3I4_9ACTN
MDTTFGDLIDGARVHLDGAIKHARDHVDGDIAAASKDAGRSLTAMLARCAEDFAHAGEVAAPIRQASLLLTRMEEPGPAAAATHPIPLHLRAAARTWGAAGDMLATHFTRHRDAPRSDWAAVIGNRQVREHLLTEVAGHALALAEILDGTALAREPDVRHACVLLRSPAVQQASLPGDAAALRAIPLNQPPQSPPPIPTVAQTPRELSAHIVDGTDTLRALCHRTQATSPRDWQRTALAASVITDLAAKALTQLIRRAYALNPDREHRLRKALQRAANGVQQANAEWKCVLHAWNGRFAPGPIVAPARQQHLEQVAVRLGRLLHDNPIWTPAEENAAPLKRPAAIAPTTADMVPIVRAVLHSIEGLRVVAERDRRDVTQALRIDVEQPGRSQLLAAYRDLGSPKGRALWSLGEAILLAAPAESRDELRQDIHLLELRRDGRTLDGQAVRKQNRTLRRPETLTAHAAMSDSRLDLSAASSAASVAVRSSPPPSPPVRHHGGPSP